MGLQKWQKFAVAGVAMAFLVVVVASGDRTATTPAAIATTRAVTSPPAPSTAVGSSYSSSDIEYKLAVIDEGGFLPVDDPSIVRYHRVLDDLQQVCGNSRTALADMAVRSVELLADRGVASDALEMLNAAEQSIPDDMHFDDCAEIFASLIVLMTS